MNMKAITLCELNNSLQDELKATETKFQNSTGAPLLNFQSFFSSLNMAPRTAKSISCVSHTVKAKRLSEDGVIVNVHIFQRTPALRLNYLSVFLCFYVIKSSSVINVRRCYFPTGTAGVRSFPKGSAGKL